MLKWYALRNDSSKRKIVDYNVLSGWEEKRRERIKNLKIMLA